MLNVAEHKRIIESNAGGIEGLLGQMWVPARVEELNIIK
jgi:hypothetical protein